MSNLKRWLIFGGSVVALSLSVFLGYWWVVERPARMPGDRADEVQQRPPEDVEVTLPQNLREEMTEQSERRERLYQEALQFHREGRLDRAVEHYQEVLSISVPDETAAEAYRLLGDIYLRADNPRRAIRLYEFAVRIVEDSPLFHYRLGRAHEVIGEFSEAASSYEQAIELEPAGLYYLARGNLAYDQGEYARAIEFYEEGLNQDDQRTRLLVNLAKAHQQRGQSSQAIETFKQALDRELSDDRRYNVLSNIGDLHMDRGEPTEAVNAFEEASSIRGTAQAYYNLGQARLEAGLLSGAVDALESARQEAPEDADIRVDLGFAYQRLGNEQEAVQQYERAIELRPDDNDLYLAAARLHERLNHPTRALIYYRELTNRLLPGPQLGLVYRRVGELYMNTNHPDSAAPAFRNALKIDSGNAEVTYNLGVAYQRTDRLDQSVEQFRRALELAPSDTDYQFVYASSLYRAGFRKRARREFLELFERAPDRHRAGYMVAHIDYTWGRLERSRNRYQALLSDVEDTTLTAAIYRNLGNIYTRSGEYARAETVLKQSLSIREDPVTYYNLGVTYAEQGAWTEANTSFREALERGPEDARFYAGVGLAMYERGVYEVAERHLQRALELDPDLTRARYDLRRVRRAMEES